MSTVNITYTNEDGIKSSFDFDISDPSEPMFVVYDAGDWEVVHDGDLDWIMDNRPTFVQAITFPAIITALERHLVHATNGVDIE